MAEQSEFDTLALRTAYTAASWRAFRGDVPHFELRIRECCAGGGALHRRAEGNIYSRFTNPTVSAFQERLARWRAPRPASPRLPACLPFSAMAMAVLKSGDHVICSASVFGSTVQLFSTIMGKFGVATTFVNGASVAAWKARCATTPSCCSSNPSNPLTEIADIAALAAVSKRAGALLAVDNCFCTPALQKPLQLGADLVIHSATKYLDGRAGYWAGRCWTGRAGDGWRIRFLRTAVLACPRSTPGCC